LTVKLCFIFNNNCRKYRYNIALFQVGVLQQELLWLLHDLGHLDKYPMALGTGTVTTSVAGYFRPDLDRTS
jgi:Menin